MYGWVLGSCNDFEAELTIPLNVTSIRRSNEAFSNPRETYTNYVDAEPERCVHNGRWLTIHR